MPLSEPAWVVPPTPSMRADRGNSLRTSIAPGYGVAASLVSLISRIGGAALPLIFTGVETLPLQKMQGALNQALAQVSNGYLAYSRQLSRCHLFQFFGHWTSVHWVPR